MHPAIFMQTMNNLFSNMLDSNMAVFLDDILVYFIYGEGKLHVTERKYWYAYISIHSTVSLRSAASYTIIQYSSGFDITP